MDDTKKNYEKLTNQRKALMDFYALILQENNWYCWNDGLDTQHFQPVEELSKKDLAGLTNQFFTPNAFGFRRKKGENPSIRRDYAHLDKLCTLYCDLDLYNDKIATHEEVYDDDAMDRIERIFYYIRMTIISKGLLPVPTAVVKSGNGLHYYWSIQPEKFAKGNDNLDKWKAMQYYIYQTLRPFGADYRVSMDPCRLMRLPETLNEKKDNQNSIVTKEATVWQTEPVRYKLEDLILAYNIEVKSYKKKTEPSKQTQEKKEPKKLPSKLNLSGITNKWAIVALERACDIEYLLLNYPCVGRREIGLFYYRLFMLQGQKNVEEALKLTLQLNSRLSDPLSEKEVRTATKSANGAYTKQHKVSNETLVEQLGITPDEGKHMKSILSEEEHKARISQRNRNQYEKRLKNQGKRTKKERKIEMQKYIVDYTSRGWTNKDIADVLHISVKTVQRYKNEIKKNNALEQTDLPGKAS